jgi:DNA-binding transcriptional MerR regulator
MKIGELAKRAGISVDAIRFYEKTGLLGKPTRSEGGFRQYANEDLRSLLFIKRIQELGFSLREIREFLILQDTQPDCCSDVRDLFAKKIEEVKLKMQQLGALEKDLVRAFRNCNHQLKVFGKRHSSCPVLRKLKVPREAAR